MGKSSLSLAKIRRVKASHRIHGTNLGLLAEIARRMLAGNWLLGTKDQQEQSHEV
jgi:hypothetical protein